MEDVIRLIAQIIEEIRTKDYDRHVLRLAKNELLDLLSGQQDSLQTLMEQAFMDRLRGWNYSMEECMEIIEETTPDDLAEIAKGLHLLCQAQVLQKETSLSEDEVLSENGEGDAE